MKRLIINADDLGADEERNHGIFEAIRAGVVTSASILANGPATEHALEGARDMEPLGISWGLHLNLSEGPPLSSHPVRLTGGGERFLGKAAARRLLSRAGDIELEREVEREAAAQIALLAGAGVPIRHLDGHQHLHVFPAVARVAARAARENGIPWVRMPREPHPLAPLAPIPPSRAKEARTFTKRAQAAMIELGEGYFRTTDHFLGLYGVGRWTPESLADQIERLLPGLTELMVHPGRAPRGAARGPFASFSTLDRESELEALLHPNFRAILLSSGVTLTPFPE
jgi:predicted glycoside hydrolase/deacetylase ChbG (UPF0249 family)